MRLIRSTVVLLLLVLPGSRCLGQAPQTGKLKVITGPATVPLGANEGQLKLPQGMLYLDKKSTAELLERSGEPADEYAVGAVTDEESKFDWTGLLRYVDCGYIKDDEADSLNADDLLTTIRENTEKENEERKQKGSPTMQVSGWYRPPAYNRATHRLTWSIIGQEQGGASRTVNLTAILLGRNGIMACTIVGDLKDAAQLQPKLDRVSSALVFTQGRDYTAWRSGDKVSELTMTGLVTGGAAAAAYGAAKMGLLAKLGKLLLVILLAMKKAFIVVIAAIGGVWRWLMAKLGRRSQSPAEPGTPPGQV
jgi:uncharacterized membrane-anchored protein